MTTIEALKQRLEENFTKNHCKINPILLIPYNWPLLDSLRYEICNCILIDCTQAAITLTNHLLEKTLKSILIHNEPNYQNFTDLTEIENHYSNMNTLYGSKDLKDTIVLSTNKSLITKEQSQALNNYRIKFRNAFGHADPSKIFGETKETVVLFNPLINKEINKREVEIKNFPFLQDTTQKQIADAECENYFTYVDTLIREVIPKLFA